MSSNNKNHNNLSYLVSANNVSVINSAPPRNLSYNPLGYTNHQQIPNNYTIVNSPSYYNYYKFKK